MRRSLPESRGVAVGVWVAAVLALIPLAFFLLGLWKLIGDIGRRDPATRSDLGAVLFVLTFVLALASPLFLRSLPRSLSHRIRYRTAVVIAVLIAVSWIGGLSLSAGSDQTSSQTGPSPTLSP